jgi:hypothetical protein
LSRLGDRPGVRIWILSFLGAALCACASAPDRAGPVQYLDPNTAVHFLAVDKPLTFAHIRPQTAARVRDYATVAAASMDRDGRIEYVLLIYLWSTVDPRYGRGAWAPAPELVLLADDRRIELHPISDSTQLPPPLDRPPTRHFVAGIYHTDRDVLRYLAEAHYLSLVRGSGREEARFELWDDQRASLAALMRATQ